MKYPYQDARISAKERAKDLVSRMTDREKLAQLQCSIYFYGEGLPIENFGRIGVGHIAFCGGQGNAEENAKFVTEIQKYQTEKTNWAIPALIHSEALCGGLFADATVFPVAIGLASTWNPSRVKHMAEIVRKQMTSLGLKMTLSPVMDIARDPRWGRLGETYGEDPALAAAMSVAYVSGVQGEDLDTGVAACAKHFLGYGLPEGGMNMANCHITPRDLREIYAKPFQAAIHDAKLAAIMNSYASMDNIPVISARGILTDFLRSELGFDGVTVSDYGSIDRLTYMYRMTDDLTEAGAIALNAGMDVELCAVKCYDDKLIDSPLLDKNQFDEAICRVLELKFKLGLFEHPYPNKEKITTVFHQPEDDLASLETARESLILLKNENSLLPLSKDIKKVAVIGPHADSFRLLFGCYTFPAMYETKESSVLNPFGVSGKDNPDRVKALHDELREMYPMTKTILEAVRAHAPRAEVLYSKGCEVSGGDRSGFEQAFRLASEADVVILAVGGKSGWSEDCTIGEGVDSMNIDIPGVQEQLALEVAKINGNMIVVHLDGRPISSPRVVDAAQAVIEAWYPSIYGGDAIAEALFGEYNPSGRLPVSMLKSTGQIPTYYSQLNGSGYAGRPHIPGNRHGYADGDAQPLFVFGHGLSYTRFEYSDLVLSSKELPGEAKLTVELTVKNIGQVAGDEVVQIYLRDLAASLARPTRELVGFKRVYLPFGEARRLRMTFALSQLAFLDKDMKWKVESGQMLLEVGASSSDIRLRDEFVITKDAFFEGSERTFIAKSSVRVN